jgi:hypothetical protein
MRKKSSGMSRRQNRPGLGVPPSVNSCQLTVRAATGAYLTMAKGDDSVQGVKNHWRVNHLVVVKFSKVLDLCDPSLVIFKIVLLQANGYLFKDIIHDADDKFLMVAVKSTRKDGEKVDIAILDLPRLGEYFLQYRDYLGLVSDC